MILSAIWAECGRLLSDPNNDRWSQAVLTSRANEAQLEIQSYTNAVRTPATFSVVANTSATILIGYNVLSVLQVSLVKPDGSVVPLQGINREELDFLYPDWKQWQSGTPLVWWHDATVDTLNLVPAPDATFAASGSISTILSLNPVAMSAATDEPFDVAGQQQTAPMRPYHMSVVHWVVAYCFMDDGTPEALAKSRFHKSGSMLSPGEYEKQLGRIMAEFDVDEIVPARVLWRPQGGRTGSWMFPSKSNPLA